MGYALFADRKLYYQYLVNKLNYDLENVIQEQQRLIDKTSAVQNWEDVYKNGISVFNVLRGNQTPQQIEEQPAPQNPPQDQAVLPQINVVGADTAIPGQNDAVKPAPPKTDKEKREEMMRFRLSYNTEKAFQIMSGRNLEENIKKFVKEHPDTPLTQEIMQELAMQGNDEAAVCVTKSQLNWLKSQENYLDLKKQRIESKLKIAQTNLQAAIQGEQQAMQQAAPKFA